MVNETKVYIKTGENGKIPYYASDLSAGADLYLSADCVIRPGETKVLPLDMIIALEEDVEAQVRPRSGLSLKTTLRIPNAPGTVDSDYRDKVGVIVENSFDDSSLLNILSNSETLPRFLEEHREISMEEYLAETCSRANVSFDDLPESVRNRKVIVDKNNNPAGTVYLQKGERIAQMVFSKYEKADLIQHESPETIGSDRGGGFGHSGRK